MTSVQTRPWRRDMAQTRKSSEESPNGEGEDSPSATILRVGAEVDLNHGDGAISDAASIFVNTVFECAVSVLEEDTNNVAISESVKRLPKNTEQFTQTQSELQSDIEAVAGRNVTRATSAGSAESEPLLMLLFLATVSSISSAVKMPQREHDIPQTGATRPSVENYLTSEDGPTVEELGNTESCPCVPESELGGGLHDGWGSSSEDEFQWKGDDRPGREKGGGGNGGSNGGGDGNNGGDDEEENSRGEGREEKDEEEEEEEEEASKEEGEDDEEERQEQEQEGKVEQKGKDNRDENEEPGLGRRDGSTDETVSQDEDWISSCDEIILDDGEESPQIEGIQLRDDAEEPPQLDIVQSSQPNQLNQLDRVQPPQVDVSPRKLRMARRLRGDRRPQQTKHLEFRWETTQNLQIINEVDRSTTSGEVELSILDTLPTLEFTVRTSAESSARRMGVILGQPSHAVVLGPPGGESALVIWQGMAPEDVHSTAKGHIPCPIPPQWRLTMLLPWDNELISPERAHELLMHVLEARRDSKNGQVNEDEEDYTPQCCFSFSSEPSKMGRQPAQTRRATVPAKMPMPAAKETPSALPSLFTTVEPKEKRRMSVQEENKWMQVHSAARWGKFDEVKQMVKDNMVDLQDPKTGNVTLHIAAQVMFPALQV